ncbi:hypothetical protein [Chitinophaga skermanii]|uniref:hypothetical protein n=1 Tax=Chitinophaga skermanii TaxID=331697 RepID=UPI0011E5C23E|nr:hypothetical protein [Chitinophaga skermanii]
MRKGKAPISRSGFYNIFQCSSNIIPIWEIYVGYIRDECTFISNWMMASFTSRNPVPKLPFEHKCFFAKHSPTIYQALTDSLPTFHRLFTDFHPVPVDML